MTGEIGVMQARAALAHMPEGTSHGEAPDPRHVYLPSSHIKAMDPNTLLVTGMRGAGKTFWWSALQDPVVRQLLGDFSRGSMLGEKTEVRTGFGIKPAPDAYPGKDVLRELMKTGVEPRIVWRTIHAWQLAQDDHPLRRQGSWKTRMKYVTEDPEAIDRLFYDRDVQFDRQGAYFLILFDALDRCADDWKEMYQAIRGLLQAALDMRSYTRIRMKIFLRSDQIDETAITAFPDASKVLSSAVQLSWPLQELYGLLWHYLANGQDGAAFRKFLGAGEWPVVRVGKKQVRPVPRSLVSDEELRRKMFHAIAGRWMGRGPKRGFPYTWIPRHLGDTEGRVSPRSFLKALKVAAESTEDQYPEHENALHFNSIKRGVQEASKIRISELQEDYPWVDQVMRPLEGLVVPCEFEEISNRWQSGHVLDRLTEEMQQDEVKLPPRNIDKGPEGVRNDLNTLGVFQLLHDGRINIPDVFRVGYGLGRKGGVKPVR